MASYLFDGTENVTVADFDEAVDRVILDLALSDIALVSQVGTSVQITSTEGAILTLGAVTFAELTSANFLADFPILIGTDGNDTLEGSAAGGLFIGSLGEDLIGSGGEVLAFGNQDDDLIDISGDNARVYGGQGDDSISVDGAGATVVGGLGLDAIEVFNDDETAGAVVYGGNGQADAADSDDFITVVSAGDDAIYGNAGNDTIATSGGGSDSVYGGRGADNIFVGNEGNDLIYGNVGNDTIVSAGGEDVVYAGQGDDLVVVSGLETDNASGALVYGNLGSDIVIAGSAAGTGDVLDLLAGGGDLPDGVTLYGGGGLASPNDDSDLLIGSAGSDGIFGNGGDDVIAGYVAAGPGAPGLGSEDSIHGGAGDDVIVGFEGGSVIQGGLGSDIILGYTVGEDVDGLFVTGELTSAGADGVGATIFGGNAVADAGDAADTIIGTAGDDTIYGNGGDDLIDGDVGNDTIFGGQGNDLIINVAGQDVATGGAGDDEFVVLSSYANDADPETVGDFLTVTDFAQGSDTLNFDQEVVDVVNFNTTVTFESIDAIVDALAVEADVDTAAALTISSGDFEGTWVGIFDDVTGEMQVVALAGFGGDLTTADFSAEPLPDLTAIADANAAFDAFDARLGITEESVPV